MRSLRIIHILLFMSIFFIIYRIIDFIGQKRPSSDIGKPLFLTPLIKSGQIDKARKLSNVKPLLDFFDVSSFSGFLTVNETHNTNTFFWFFPAEVSPKTAPVIVWLQGGPGASSLFGLFTENGPYAVTKDLKARPRTYRWNRLFSMLYVDNPAGAGYSFTKSVHGYARNVHDYSTTLYTFMHQFYLLFPELLENELYIVGESYGGKYAPALAYKIHEKNKDKSNIQLNLKGVALGNAYSDPIHMIHFGDRLYQLGLIDLNLKTKFNRISDMAVEYIKKEKWIDAYRTMNFEIQLNNGTSLFNNATGYTYCYNFLNTNEPNTNNVNIFIQQDKVRKAIHVGDLEYNYLGLNGKVNGYLIEDIMQSVAPMVEELVEHYRILVYSGQLDLAVPYPATLKYLQNLKWSGAEEYKTAHRSIWKVGNEIAGYLKTTKNLQEVLVRNAGHMVPTDQPVFAFDLINRFVFKKDFDTL